MLYIYIYTHTHTHMYIYIHTDMSFSKWRYAPISPISRHVTKQLCVQGEKRACVCVNTYIHECVCVNTYIHECVCVYTCVSKGRSPTKVLASVLHTDLSVHIGVYRYISVQIGTCRCISVHIGVYLCVEGEESDQGVGFCPSFTLFLQRLENTLIRGGVENKLIREGVGFCPSFTLFLQRLENTLIRGGVENSPSFTLFLWPWGGSLRLLLLMCSLPSALSKIYTYNIHIYTHTHTYIHQR